MEANEIEVKDAVLVLSSGKEADYEFYKLMTK